MQEFCPKTMPRGMSLIEVIVALAVIAVLLVSVLGLFPRGLAAAGSAADYTTAVNLAQAEIENILSQNYDEVAVGTTVARGPAVSLSTDPLYRFEREVTATYVDDDLNPSSTDSGLKQVTVSIYYPSRYGEKTYIVNTFIADR